MLRCHSCNVSLRADEKVCFACNTAVPDAHPKPSFGQRFQSVVNVMFIISAILTVASIFTDYVPGFLKCFGTMAILYFVKNSADQMSEPKKG